MAEVLDSPRNPKYSTLDSWRGIACLMIVVLHAVHYANESGQAGSKAAKATLMILAKFSVGVPMFFVISGYCIAATSDSTRRRPRAPVQFFSRRFRRIFPPYWALAAICVGVVVALTAVGQADLVSDEYGLIPHPSRLTWSEWLGYVTLSETWRPHLFGDPELKVVGPAWTLCYEDQFYAVCGLVRLVVPRRFFAGVAAVTVLTLAVAPLGLAPGGPAIQGFFFDGRWLMFAEGVAVYYVLNYSRSKARGVAAFVALLLAVSALRWGVPAVSVNDLWRNRTGELVWSMGFALALILLHPWDHLMSRSPLFRPLAVCGRMCYSLYLVHWPVTVVITTYFYRAGVRGVWPTLLIVAPLAIAASIVAAWLFHLAVERRFLNRPVAGPPLPGSEKQRASVVPQYEGVRVGG
jgi:peptidoglycan/LPS O-acetylase OafA/YrhL